ncbi:MAG: RCC1-like domain-containing protein [Limisphaerales bacterium]
MNRPFKWAPAFLGAILVLALVFCAGRLTSDAYQKKCKLPTGSCKPAVAIGDNHGVILASDGSLWTWGGKWVRLAGVRSGQQRHDPSLPEAHWSGNQLGEHCCWGFNLAGAQG